MKRGDNMARIRSGRNQEQIVSMNRWLGVNENPDGDINLKFGEASAMTNFKITRGGSLQTRPGTQNVANLLFDYDVAVAAEAMTVLTETSGSTATFTVYPSYNVTDGGLLYLNGTPATVSSVNILAHEGEYWQDAYGVTWQLGVCEYTAGSGSGVYTWRFYRVSLVPNTADNKVRGIWSGRVAAEEVICAACNGYLWVLLETDGVWYKSKLGPVDTNKEVHMFGFDSKLYIMNGSEYLVWAARGKDMTYTASIQAASGTDRQFCMFIDGVYYLCHLASWVTGDTLVYRPITNVLTHQGMPVAFTTAAQVFEGGGLISTAAPLLSLTYDPPEEVAGYRPLIAKEVLPTGGGTLLQRVNLLSGARRIQCSPNGSAVTFTLPEKNLASIDYVHDMATGTSLSIASSSLTAGTVTLTSAPATGTDTIEIGYTAATALRGTVEGMTRSELYNGGADSRIFLYGDDTNKVVYSDLDYNGRPRADYFPDLNFVHVGASNTPVTSMVRHHDRLLAFKEDSAYSIAYNALTLPGGSVTAGFYVTTINKGIGSAGLGQAVLVENHPRTLDGRSVYEWVATTTSGNITSDQRNALCVSQNVRSTLREIDETKAIALYDKVNHEYYVVENSIAIIQNTENGAWFIYRDFPAVCMIVYRDELYYGTADGFLRHVSRAYRHDCGAPIQCRWESGSMDFGMAYRKKSSDMIWIVLQPEAGAAVTVTVQTDRQSTPQDGTVSEAYSSPAAGANLDNSNVSFSVSSKPHTQRRKLSVRNFTWYKLIFSSASRDTTATLLNADIRVRPTSLVR